MTGFDIARVEKLARELTATLTQAWNVPTEALAVTFTVNPRLKRAVARFLRAGRVIELGPRFFEVPARQTEVLCHELAHAAIDFVHGADARAHGPEWRRLVEAAGYRAEARTVRVQPIEQSSAVRERRTMQKSVYEHRCPVCQMVRRAKRPVPQWRCAECVAAGLSGTLVIERLPDR